MKKISLLIALCCTTSVHAGLFEDDEARRAILDARKKIETQSEVIKKNSDDIQQCDPCRVVSFLHSAAESHP